MGMETAPAHVIPDRNVFGLEITRLDMKLLPDMLAKEACCKKSWLDEIAGGRLHARKIEESARLDKSLTMYLTNKRNHEEYKRRRGGFH